MNIIIISLVMAAAVYMSLSKQAGGGLAGGHVDRGN